MFTDNPEEGLNYIVDATCTDKPKIGYVSRILDRVYIRFMSEAFMESIMTDKQLADTYRFKKVPTLDPNEIAVQVKLLNKNSKERRLEELREEIRMLEEEEDFPLEEENLPETPTPQICFPEIKSLTIQHTTVNPKDLPHA